MTKSPTLKKYVDRLPVPPVAQPHEGRLRITLEPGRAKLHRDLPESDFWTYGGVIPGPTIEVRRGEEVEVDWVSSPTLSGSPYPVVAVVGAPANSQNSPGTVGGTVDAKVKALTPWNVVHVHGARVAGSSDGWTENCLLPGETATCRYPNDQRATMLWYHDHAMGITRLNVHAGLAGMWFVRDAEEDHLGLPSGEHEVPLLIADRNLDLDAKGKFTGGVLHKVEMDTSEFYGPYTTVNGKIWPYFDAEPRQYRFRVLNASNARVYRLVLVDENGADLSHLMRQIGTDGGLLGAPVSLPSGGLLLASAERADLIVDLRKQAGTTLRLVNTAWAPFHGDAFPSELKPGEADPNEDNKLTEPAVMEIRVSKAKVKDSFKLPRRLSEVRPFTHDDLPAQHKHRTVVLVERPVGNLQLCETLPLGSSPPLSRMGALVPNGNDLIGTVLPLQDASGLSYHAVIATHFDETTNWHVRHGDWEVWRILNTTGDTHPFHVHLVQFQAMKRDEWEEGGWNADMGMALSPLKYAGPLTLDDNELGLKDTIRVNPNEMVTIAAKFEGATGRYMYHCHILEHEDHDMMRSFVVAPGAVLDLMDMKGMTGDMANMPGMGGMGGADTGCEGCTDDHDSHCC